MPVPHTGKTDEHRQAFPGVNPAKANRLSWFVPPAQRLNTADAAATRRRRRTVAYRASAAGVVFGLFQLCWTSARTALALAAPAHAIVCRTELASGSQARKRLLLFA